MCRHRRHGTVLFTVPLAAVLALLVALVALPEREALGRAPAAPAARLATPPAPPTGVPTPMPAATPTMRLPGLPRCGCGGGQHLPLPQASPRGGPRSPLIRRRAHPPRPPAATSGGIAVPADPVLRIVSARGDTRHRSRPRRRPLRAGAVRLRPRRDERQERRIQRADRGGARWLGPERAMPYPCSQRPAPTGPQRREETLALATRAPPPRGTRRTTASGPGRREGAGLVLHAGRPAWGRSPGKEEGEHG